MSHDRGIKISIVSCINIRHADEALVDIHGDKKRSGYKGCFALHPIKEPITREVSDLFIAGTFPKLAIEMMLQPLAGSTSYSDHLYH